MVGWTRNVSGENFSGSDNHCIGGNTRMNNFTGCIVIHGIEIADNVFFRFHDGKACPRFDTTHKFAVHLHVEPGSIAFCRLIRHVSDPYIVDLVGGQVGHKFVVQFGREFKRAVPGPKNIVGTQNNL